MANMDATLTPDEVADLAGETLPQLHSLEGFDSPDLAGKLDASVFRPVQSLAARRRALEAQRTGAEIALVYRGSREGPFHAGAIDVTVPDTENAATVRRAVAPLKLVDEADWDTEARRIKADLHERFHMSGPSYHFARDETVLVAASDAPFLLHHPEHLIERATDVHAERERKALQEHPLWTATQAENADLRTRLERLEQAIAQQQTHETPED